MGQLGSYLVPTLEDRILVTTHLEIWALVSIPLLILCSLGKAKSILEINSQMI
jgi:hypothetical protein